MENGAHVGRSEKGKGERRDSEVLFKISLKFSSVSSSLYITTSIHLLFTFVGDCYQASKLGLWSYSTLPSLGCGVTVQLQYNRTLNTPFKRLVSAFTLLYIYFTLVGLLQAWVVELQYSYSTKEL